MPSNRRGGPAASLVDAEHPYALVFYRDASGRPVALEWMRGLPPVKRQALGHHMHQTLQRLGPAVCRTEAGRNLGRGLLEYRLRAKAPPATKAVDVLLRVFFHDLGDERLLVLDGYDKGENPSATYQNERIARARGYLADFQTRALPELRRSRQLP